jgi:hypothetical protein
MRLLGPSCNLKRRLEIIRTRRELSQSGSHQASSDFGLPCVFQARPGGCTVTALTIAIGVGVQPRSSRSPTGCF